MKTDYPGRRAGKAVSTSASAILKIIQDRRSARVPFDSHHPVEKESLRKIIEAARWAPTPHNMQNFEIILVDDEKLLEALGRIRSRTSMEFLRENYQQLSFSKKEQLQKKVGVLAAQFPASWRDPAEFEEVANEGAGASLSQIINGSPTLLIVTYDPRKRAPASEGDSLGFMGLGCVMQNVWLMAYSLGVGVHILSVFGREPEEKVKQLLHVPKEMKIAYAVRLGYPVRQPAKYMRMRRSANVLIHHNLYRSTD
jgi:nitroreductase